MRPAGLGERAAPYLLVDAGEVNPYKPRNW